MASTTQHVGCSARSAHVHAAPIDPTQVKHLPEELMQWIIECLAPLELTPFIDSNGVCSTQNDWNPSIYEGPSIDPRGPWYENDLRRSTLAALACVSKSITRLALQVLYRAVDLQEINKPRIDNLSPILTYLLRHPETRVQTLCLPDFAPEVTDPFLDPLSSDTLQLCNKYLGRLPLPDDTRATILAGLTMCHSDALIALTLMICPHLKALHLTVAFDYDKTLVYRLFESYHEDAEYNPLSFNLQRASISYCDLGSLVPCRYIKTILQSKSLLTFSGNKMSYMEPDLEWGQIDSIPTARYLHFEDSLIDNAGFEILLSSCGDKLESFTYITGMSDPESDDIELSFPATGDVFRRHGTRLKKLRLDFDEATYWLGADKASALPLGSLKTLASLTELDLNLNALLGLEQGPGYDEVRLRSKLQDVLPDSIRVLTIRDNTGETDYQLDWQIVQAIHNFPYLQLVTLHDRKTFTTDLVGTGWTVTFCGEFDYDRWIELRPVTNEAVSVR